MQQVAESLTAGTVSIDDGDAGGPGQAQFDGNGSCGAASTQHHHMLSLRGGDGLQGGKESLTIGIFSDPLPVSLNHAIDGPHDPS